MKWDRKINENIKKYQEELKSMIEGIDEFGRIKSKSLNEIKIIKKHRKLWQKQVEEQTGSTSDTL